MSDQEKQQENQPESIPGTNPTTSQEVGGVVEDIPVAGEPGKNEELDWELQVAQAYQQAEASEQTNVAAADGRASAQPSVSSAESSYMVELKEEKEFLQAQLEATKAQLEDSSNQYRRLAADFENYRKRSQKEKEELDLQVKSATIIKLLPVIDNFERARSHIKPQNDGEMNIHKSYQSVYKQLVECLKQIGVSPMRPEGEAFDPSFHEAVMREATTEYPEGSVTEELVRGYMLGDRVLRHAMVKVAAPPDEAVGISEGSPPETSEDALS